MERFVGAVLDAHDPRRLPAWGRWSIVAAAVGLAYVVRFAMPGLPPMLPFVVAVLAAAAICGLRCGFVATCAALAVAFGPVAPAAHEGLPSLPPGQRALLFALVGMALSIGVDALRGQHARLAAAADRMRLVAENAPVMIAHCDRDGRYLFASNAYCERYGIAPQDIVGRSIQDVLGDRAFGRISGELARVLAGERVEFEAELAYRDLGSRYMKVSYAPDFDASGAVRGLFVALTDLTEHRRMEERLRRIDRRKDEYLAVLSHELRNPLAPIRTAARALERIDASALPARDAAVLRAGVPMIRRQAVHLSRLVDDLLDVTRMSRGAITLDRRPTSLAAALQVALDTTRELIESRGHRLAVELPAQDTVLDADPARLAQIVSNLLHNAAKFTPAGGHLRLRAWPGPEDASVVIEISDDGIGIARDRIGSIFEMFAQSERPADLAEGGLGIGLALVRNLVRLHGGTVAVASPGPGRGSTFTVRLPLRSKQVDPPAADVPPRGSPPDPPDAPARDAGRSNGPRRADATIGG
jgi:PAS domain S-box-containing protein